MQFDIGDFEKPAGCSVFQSNLYLRTKIIIQLLSARNTKKHLVFLVPLWGVSKRHIYYLNICVVSYIRVLNNIHRLFKTLYNL